MWCPWATVDLVVDPNLEVAAIVTFRLSQLLKGGRLRVIYLAKGVCYQLVGEDTP